MKKNLTHQQFKKLGQYSVLAAAFMSTANQVQADPVAVCPDPDVTVTLGNPFTIDFDGDGFIDHTVSVETFGGASSFGVVNPYYSTLGGANAVAGSSFYAPYALNSGDVMDGGLATVSTAFGGSGGAAQLYGDDGNGTFTPGTNAFVGIRFVADRVGAQTTHFGWIRIETVSSSEYNVLSYGFNDTPNEASIVGSGKAIPTMSQWGLITFALMMLSFGTIAIGRKKRIMPDGTTVDMGVAYEFRNPPFQMAYFKKAVLLTLGLIGLATTGTLLAYGTIAMVDVIGFTIAAPIFAYLAHLMMHQNEEWKNNQAK